MKRIVSKSCFIQDGLESVGQSALNSAITVATVGGIIYSGVNAYQETARKAASKNIKEGGKKIKQGFKKAGEAIQSGWEAINPAN